MRERVPLWFIVGGGLWIGLLAVLAGRPVHVVDLDDVTFGALGFLVGALVKPGWCEWPTSSDT